MQFHEDGPLRWLSFELLDEAGLVNAVILKPFNMAFDKGQDKEAILSNLETVRRKFKLERLSYTKQVHGDEVAIVSKGSPLAACDALVTQESDHGLLMSHADCQIACFYDPIQKVVATAHAGWRGNVKRLYTKTISHMKEKFQSHPANILVAISPSLGPHYSEFRSWAEEWPPEFWHYLQEPCHLDLWQIAEDELMENGILPEHMQIARLCTYENKDDFFSFRRQVHEGGPRIAHETGATLIGMP